MQRGNQATTAFAYLYNCPPTLFKFERTDDVAISISLPRPRLVDADVQDEITVMEMTIPFPVQDQRTLIVFDGDIPWQGCPRGATHLVRVDLCDIPLQLRQMRKKRVFEETRPETIFTREDGRVCLCLQRHFILVPAATLFVRRYRPGGTLARYSLVEVRRNGVYSEVTWRNSSY